MSAVAMPVFSRDPIGYEDGMNLYAYVGNDPVNKSDPMGLRTDIDIGYEVDDGAIPQMPADAPEWYRYAESGTVGAVGAAAVGVAGANAPAWIVASLVEAGRQIVGFYMRNSGVLNQIGEGALKGTIAGWTDQKTGLYDPSKPYALAVSYAVEGVAFHIKNRPQFCHPKK